MVHLRERRGLAAARASYEVPLTLAAVLWVVFIAVVPVYAQPKPRMRLEMCGNQGNTPTKSCVVDGDMLWLGGENIRSRTMKCQSPRAAIASGTMKSPWGSKQVLVLRVAQQ